MAYYQNDDEEQLNPDSQQGGVQIGGETATLTGGSGQPGSASGPDKSSANFVNVGDYVNANKPQGAKLGDQTAGVIQKAGDEARGAQTGLQQEAEQRIGAGTTRSLGQGILERIKSAPESLSQDERQQAKTVANATYQGPKAATDLGDAYTKARQAEEAAKQKIDMSGSEQGRMGLITQVNDKPRTQGMNVFDNLLLQAGGGKEKLATTAQANKGVLGGTDKTAEQIGKNIQSAQAQTQGAQSQAYNEIQNALNSWKQSFQPRIQQAQNDLIARQNAVAGDITDSELDPETMALFGLSAGDNLYDLNLASYLQEANPGAFNASNVADASDFARYAALADLAGDQSGFIDQSKAGSAPRISADVSRLKQDLGAASEKYQGSVKETQKKISQLEAAAKDPTKDPEFVAWKKASQAPRYPGGPPQSVDIGAENRVIQELRAKRQEELAAAQQELQRVSQNPVRVVNPDAAAKHSGVAPGKGVQLKGGA